jgi:NAD+ diphosphatase
MEPGESIEEAVRREVAEEAGIDVGRVAYHSSQPWPFPSTLMIGCLAEARRDEIRLDPEELEDARWFSRSELRQALGRWREGAGLRLPPPITIAHQLAAHWLEETGQAH